MIKINSPQGYVNFAGKFGDDTLQCVEPKKPNNSRDFRSDYDLAKTQMLRNGYNNGDVPVRTWLDDQNYYINKYVKLPDGTIKMVRARL